ncbi:competence protein CoiA family protein [Indioceanicola profundi]|uniref:competence protein CoiA family protein n=1 Tax=Indioceanicola profundi TaxID=2220096 RepID=UPI0013C511AD|nr:hypothetical protein [Indioceanicola profundi]
MPQKALLDDRVILAIDHDEAAWSAVRQRSKAGDIRMACCGGRGIAKTSSSGLFFFSHIGSPCAGAGGESIVHERLKVEAYRVAQELGFGVELEAAGEGWRADVLLTHPTRGYQIAVEIQRSPQEVFVTRARISRYRAAGLKSMWFFLRHRDYDALPRDLKEMAVFTIRSGAPEAQQISLRRQMEGVLTGRWKYDRGQGLDRVPFTVAGAPILCGRCGQSYHRISGIVLHLDTVRGDLKPAFVDIVNAPRAESLIKDYERRQGVRGSAIVRGLPVLGMGYDDHRACPYCRCDEQPDSLAIEDLALHPADPIDGTTDARRLIGFRPGWRPKSPPPASAHRLTRAEWLALAARRQAAVRKGPAVCGGAGQLEPLRTAALIQREMDAMLAIAAPVLGQEAAIALLDTELDLLDGMTPRESAARHAMMPWSYRQACPAKKIIEAAAAAGTLWDLLHGE